MVTSVKVIAAFPVVSSKVNPPIETESGPVFVRVTSSEAPDVPASTVTSWAMMMISASARRGPIRAARARATTGAQRRSGTAI